jgi:hypothetical protein
VEAQPDGRRKGVEFATNRQVAETSRRLQAQFQVDQPVPNQDSKVHVGMSRKEYQQWKEFNPMAEFRQQQQGQLNPIVDPAPSWKPEHPTDEEQKGV